MLGLRHRRPRKFWNEDLARFIGTHRECGGDLRVSKLGPAVQITCKGCGDRIVRGRPPRGVLPEGLPPRPPRPSRPKRVARARPTRRSAALLATLLVATAAIVAALSGGSGPGGSQPEPTPAEAESSPLGSAVPAAAATATAPPIAATARTRPQGAAPGSAAGSPSPSGLPFRTRLPRGWADAVRGTAVLFAPAEASPPVIVSV